MMYEFTEKMITATATQPLEFQMKLAVEFRRDRGSKFVPYPGWRWVPTLDGGMRHEKIPSLWQRMREGLRRGIGPTVRIPGPAPGDKYIPRKDRQQ